MTWPEEAARHAGHWLRLDGTDALRCHTCDKDTGRRILLPLRVDLVATPTPPPFQINTENIATPEQIARRKREALAALEAARQRRTTNPNPKD